MYLFCMFMIFLLVLEERIVHHRYSYLFVYRYVFVCIRYHIFCYSAKKRLFSSIKKFDKYIYIDNIPLNFYSYFPCTWSAILSKKTVKPMKSLFFAIRRHFFRLVLQTNFAIVRLILANSHIERFVKKQLFVTTIALFQNNFNRKNPQNSGDFFLSIMHTNISSHILKVSLCHKILI